MQVFIICAVDLRSRKHHISEAENVRDVKIFEIQGGRAGPRRANPTKARRNDRAAIRDAF
jgi:hypothetical protein